MRSRGTLEVMKLKGTVKNGVIAVDLPEGTAVTVEVEVPLMEDGPSWGTEDDASLSEIPRYKLDAAGELVMTPELEASLRLAEAEADRGEGIPLEDVISMLRRDR